MQSLGLPFQVLAPEAEEEEPNWQTVDEVTRKNSLRKAEVAQQNIPVENAIIVAADTLVVLGQEVIGKPATIADVKKTLRKFSGQRQTVVTGLTLLSHFFGCRQTNVKTAIYFRHLSDQEIDDYSQTHEPFDKAGGYAVQGLGSLFIDKMEGSYTNAMGLPIEKLLEELGQLTGIPPYRWFLK